jgi:hypothetical protein
MKKLLIIAVLTGGIYFGLKYLDIDLPKLTHKTTETTQKYNTPVKRTSYDLPSSGSRFSGSGRVSRILSDDNIGSKHQRFILTLSSGQTILIAHNIDIAPRVPSLNNGDIIYFNGIYEKNFKGGVVHWTHHDPSGRHSAGWLKKNGHIYQ